MMKLLIWDFDGTLGYRHGGAWTATLYEVLQRELPSHGATFDDLRPFMASGFRWQMTEQAHVPVHAADPATADAWWGELEAIFVQAYLSVGLSEREAQRLSRCFRPAYLDPTRWRRFEDAAPTLKVLADRGWRHVILSNHVPELPDLVRAVGLASYFDRIFNSAEIGYEKPHPAAFEAVRHAFPDVGAAWMVGDSYSADVLGAEAVGIPAVLVRRCLPEARFCLPDLNGLPALLAENV
jgi:putative hydrolase of the HAD superfamily